MTDNDGYLPLPKGFTTIAIHEAQDPEQWSHHEIVTPITMTSTFKQDEPGVFKYQYGRIGNPTREVLEKVIAKMECAKYGACFSSGLGAITTVIGLLENGDHMICMDDVYGGTNRLFLQIATKFGIEVTFADGDVDSFERQIKPNTKMIFVESPTNPTMRLCDIKAITSMAKRYKVMFVIDNTFLTPYYQRPLLLGADVVMHSLTKYMNGHSDIIMGALVTNDDKLGEKIYFLQKAMGVVPSPFDCSQVLRSLKTLALRLKKHQANSLVLAKYLETHPKIERVLHPGLPSHPQHELAKRQSSGHSGMFSVYLKGDLETSKKFLKSLKYFALGGSLGGAESLIALSTKMTHTSVPKDQRDKLGITDNLIRISVGIEDVEDLIADMKYALDQI
ncbi:putative cystathionine gamma-lyase 2 [Harmonia axyridis]|uniref:putative cystathionine gamma-lyase 2 n=1 Tax=Harmonia axyridis TaxID=115357 RepID=UPI001E2772C2|nr:putative cystathionine gamma-lyase 2 [Harmonia axyridis]